MDLFKDRTVQFRLNSITKISTEVTGTIETAAQTIAGVDHCNAYLGYYNNILIQLHQVTLDQVRAFSGWLMGDESSSLTTSMYMKIKDIDPNVADQPSHF